MTETFNPLGTAGALGEVAFPDEAFECPYCGQLLAPSCRVCVSCKLPIDPSRIKKSGPVDLSPPILETAPTVPPVRFSWGIFVAVVAVYWVVGTVVLMILGADNGRLFLTVTQPIIAGWVFFDARRKGIPKPLRWGVGTLLFWIVFVPWYLARRAKPKAPCPFVEAENGPFTRFVLLLIFIFFLAYLILFYVYGAPL
jgi:hypothetical protein